MGTLDHSLIQQLTNLNQWFLFTPDKTLANLSELGCPNSLQKTRKFTQKNLGWDFRTSHSLTYFIIFMFLRLDLFTITIAIFKSVFTRSMFACRCWITSKWKGKADWLNLVIVASSLALHRLPPLLLLLVRLTEVLKMKTFKKSLQSSFK